MNILNKNYLNEMKNVLKKLTNDSRFLDKVEKLATYLSDDFDVEFEKWNASENHLGQFLLDNENDGFEVLVKIINNIPTLILNQGATTIAFI